MNKINKGIASQQSQQVILNPHLNHLPQQIPQQASLQQHHIPPPHILDHTQSQVNNYSFNPQNGHFLNATGNSAVIGGRVGGDGSLASIATTSNLTSVQTNNTQVRLLGIFEENLHRGYSVLRKRELFDSRWFSFF